MNPEPASSSESRAGNETDNETKPKRKSPGLEDPYVHAPPKPDGDPWEILLKPELEADKIRCDAWKDEVQNLLIFAGLFSAVVTAFLIESYKLLLPDPNDTVISLLTQIASGTTITSAPLSTATLPAQSSSSIRINIFWFISLVLSLTTVLVGTIALQWLREHQSYPGFSPKETLAMLHMRSEALETWHVSRIFAALPLLLQGALVLFLAGLIDFTLRLGTKLAIPVACIIGLILLFLAATTVLPALQGLLLLSRHFPQTQLPAPCAYKSPQSQSFRKLVRFCLHFLSYLWPKLYVREDQRWKYPPRSDSLPDRQRHLYPHIYTTWYKKSWSFFDFEWLYLRDAVHNKILDNDPDLFNHKDEERMQGAFPLSDITRCLVEIIPDFSSTKRTEEYLVAACYCFEELSASVWKTEWPIRFRVDRRNNYFEKLQREILKGSIATFLTHGGMYKYDVFPDEKTKIKAHLHFGWYHVLFHLDHICIFLDRLLIGRFSHALERYRLEMRSRIIPCLLQSDVKTFTPIANTINSNFIPALHVPYFESENGFMNPSDSVNILSSMFKRHASNEMELSTNPFYTHSSVPDTLDILAGGIIYYLKLLADAHDSSDADPAASKQELENIGKEYGSGFSLVAKCLHDEIPSDSESSVASLVFYRVAILLQRVVCRMTMPFNTNIIPMDGLLKEGLTTLLQAVAHCRDRMKGRRNEPLETLFEGSDMFHSEKLEKTVLEDISRFSDAWWTEIFKGYERLGLYDPKTMAPSVPLDIAIHPPMSNSTSSLEVAALSPATTSGRHLPENKAAATSVRYSLDNLRNTDSDTLPSDQADRRHVTGIEAEQPCSLDSSQAGFIATGDVLPRDSARGYSIINMDARR